MNKPVKEIEDHRLTPIYYQVVVSNEKLARVGHDEEILRRYTMREAAESLAHMILEGEQYNVTVENDEQRQARVHTYTTFVLTNRTTQDDLKEHIEGVKKAERYLERMRIVEKLNDTANRMDTFTAHTPSSAIHMCAETLLNEDPT